MVDFDRVHRNWGASKPRRKERCMKVPNVWGVRFSESGKALLVQFDDFSDVYVPIGQIHPTSEVREPDDRGDLVVTQWICEQKDELLERAEEIEDDGRF